MSKKTRGLGMVSSHTVATLTVGDVTVRTNLTASDLTDPRLFRVRGQKCPGTLRTPTAWLDLVQALTGEASRRTVKRP